MQYLDHDLDEYVVSFKDQAERDRKIKSLAIDMLNSIEEFHNLTEFAHRDIKPLNFRVHKNKLYLTDFGLSAEYMKDGQHIAQGIDCPLMGSMRYASHWTHEGISLSRRDDIEMLGYSILKLLHDNPKDELWSQIMQKDILHLSQTEMDVQFYKEKMNFVKNQVTNPRFL